ncbi:MAG: hypothetical protein CMA85_00090 [Euryarchaeota archaeon]|nr:hypothetical protein [Euryarchaeota archaeon]
MAYQWAISEATLYVVIEFTDCIHEFSNRWISFILDNELRMNCLYYIIGIKAILAYRHEPSTDEELCSCWDFLLRITFVAKSFFVGLYFFSLYFLTKGFGAGTTNPFSLFFFGNQLLLTVFTTALVTHSSFRFPLVQWAKSTNRTIHVCQ